MDQSDIEAIDHLNRIQLARNFALANTSVSPSAIAASSLIGGAGGLASILVFLKWVMG